MHDNSLSPRSFPIAAWLVSHMLSLFKFMRERERVLSYTSVTLISSNVKTSPPTKFVVDSSQLSLSIINWESLELV